MTLISANDPHKVCEWKRQHGNCNAMLKHRLKSYQQWCPQSKCVSVLLSSPIVLLTPVAIYQQQQQQQHQVVWYCCEFIHWIAFTPLDLRQLWCVCVFVYLACTKKGLQIDWSDLNEKKEWMKERKTRSTFGQSNRKRIIDAINGWLTFRQIGHRPGQTNGLQCWWCWWPIDQQSKPSGAQFN